MFRLTADQTGDLGELVVAIDLSRPVRGRYRRPLFRATHLGGKYPTVDFIVDVLAADSTALGFFFVQVKSTASAPPTGARLPLTAVSAERYNQLAGIPAPTYLVGVDVTTETSYLVAAHRARKTPLTSITKAHPLRDDAVKIGLYREVLAFWKSSRPALQRTRFHDG
jgi:hypothetical protein